MIDNRTTRRSVLFATVAAGAATAATLTQPALPAKAAERPAARGMPGFISTRDSVSLHYKDWGSGKPVLFLHAWGLPSDMWSYQMAPLSEEGLRCVAYDRRGHGRSSDPGRGYDFDTLADDLASVIEALDLRDVALVAMSMASGEIVRYVTRHGSARISRLVFIAPFATPFLMKTKDNPDGIDGSVFEHFRRSMLLRDYPKWLEDGARPFFVSDTSREMIDWIKGLMLQNSMKALVECNRIATSTDFRPELARIGLPTLVIHGDKDSSAPLDLTGRTRNLRDALITLDGRRAGASYKDIAILIYGAEDVAADWGGGLRQRMQRHYSRGAALAAGGYRDFLR